MALRGLWLAGLGCLLLWSDTYRLPESLTGNELGTWHQEVKVEYCGGYMPAVIVSGRMYEEIQGEQREIQRWTEITRRRLTVTVEGER